MRATAFTILALVTTAALAGAPFDSARENARLAQGGQPAPVVAETTATAIPGVIAAGTKVEVIKSGFSGTEGPIGLPDGSLIFTETQANRITKIDKDNNTSTFLENTNGSNGLAFDSKGRLISVQTTPGKTLIGVIYPKGQEATLSDNLRRASRIGRPNDLVVDKKGGVYFSEPGPNAIAGPAAADSAAVAGGLLRAAGRQVDPDRRGHRPSERHPAEPRREDALRERHQRRVRAGVRHQGRRHRGKQRNFAKYPTVNKAPAGGVTSGADGLAIDNSGRVYVVSLGGIHVFNPKGELLGTIPVSLQPQNIAFAGADKKTLYIVGRGAAFKVRLLTEGYKGGRSSHADLRIRLQEMRQGIRDAGAARIGRADVPVVPEHRG